jgi:hypothetical protein
MVKRFGKLSRPAIFSFLLLVETMSGQRNGIMVAQENSGPLELSERGPGVSTSMFGTYIKESELLIYPFFEYYHDNDFEYKPSELGYGLDRDYRGRYRASEGLLFLSYGFTSDLAVEFEAAVISATIEKSPSDLSGIPPKVEESGLGDVEGQIRWRFARETENTPEAFAFFETVFPLQKNKRIIGTSDWEFKLGFGLIREFTWGTMTIRTAGEFIRAERKFEAGEIAIEYLRQLSTDWRIVTSLEVNQLDEVALITEGQWGFAPHATLKFNIGWGLTTNEIDFAPEVGILMSF